MRQSLPCQRSRLIQAAMQQIPCDLTIENVLFVNMFTGEMYPAHVDVLDGRVVRVREGGEQTGSLPAKTVYDGAGAYLVPGFIDTHMHVESTMMIPENFSRAVVPWGTTTICSDPHEIANVMGMDGVRFMLENSKNSTLRQYNLVPSCVPAVPRFESSGAVFGPAEVGALLDEPDVVGIAEVMDTAGVYQDDERMHNILDEGLRRGAYLQGHAPSTLGKELAAYRLGGPVSDHESYNEEDVQEKLRTGMYINLRAGSITNTLQHLVPGFKNNRWKERVTLCTDDKYAKEIQQVGHINNVVKQALGCGVNPLDAYRMGTLNAAQEYGFDDLGAIAPGYMADIQLLRELDGGLPEAVFIGGELVAKDGQYLGDDRMDILFDFPNTVNVPQVTGPEVFRLKAPVGCGESVVVNVIQRDKEQWHINRLREVALPVRKGYVSLEGHDELNFVCVVNRYGTGEVMIGLYDNFGLVHGALGSTVSHDSHNLTVIYKQPEDAYLAACTLRDNGGGMCVVADGKVEAVLPLPVGGLMSPLPSQRLVPRIEALDAAYAKLRQDDFSVMKSTTISLPCMPRILITNKGIVDGKNQQFVPLFPHYPKG